MTPSANIASIVVLAGFGIAAGIAVLYHYLTTQHSEEEQHRYRRRSPSPSSARSSRSSSRGRRRLRAISPPRETQTINRTAQTSADPSNGVRCRAEEIPSCRICLERMTPDSRTIRLECEHIFHDECYTIWRYTVVMNNPQANLCPSC